MRMISGAILVLASAVSASGYEISQAVNKFQGGSLLFLAWILGLAGMAQMATSWFDESRRDNITDNSRQEKKK